MLPESFAASSEKKPLTMWASGAISADQARERSYQQLTLPRAHPWKPKPDSSSPQEPPE
jgi:hypothetical protein